MTDQKKAKRDFGSFHASNVQELLSCDEKDYVPPNIPVELPKFTFGPNSGVAVGKAAKQEYFLLEEECCFLNHGAFGGVLRQAAEVAQKWQMYVERQPLRFYDRELLPLLVYVSRRLAKFVGCHATDLVLVNNATFGTNSVLTSLDFGADDVILTLNITYGAVKKLVHHICSKTGATNREIFIGFPLKSKEKILEAIEAELKPEVKLLIVDHIPSNTPIILPVKDIIHMCRKKGILVFVDGAHALGSIPLMLKDLNPDFYVSNCHKWFSCPKGAAFLYVKQNLQKQIHPAVISHGLGSGFNSEFVWSGLHDYSPLLSLLTVLDFWETAGADKIQEYMHSTASKAANVLMASWDSVLAAPKELFGSMSLIQLPKKIHSQFSTIDYNAAEKIQNILYHQYNIEVPVKSVQGSLYVRISAHLYNHISEYEYLAKAVNEIVDKDLLTNPSQNNGDIGV